MPAVVLQSPSPIVGIKNFAGTQINPARTEDLAALPAAVAAAKDDADAIMRGIMRNLRSLGIVDASGRQRISVEVMPSVTATATATIANGTITNNVGTVRLDIAGGWGLQNAYEQIAGLKVDFRNAYANATRRQLTWDASATVEVRGEGTPAENGLELRAAYAAAKLLMPGGAALSATNRALVKIAQGTYDLTAGGTWTWDANFVDLVGVAGTVEYVGGAVASSTPTIRVSAAVRLSGLTDVHAERLLFQATTGTFVANGAVWEVVGSTLAKATMRDIGWVDTTALTLRAVDIAAQTVGGSWRNCYTAMPGLLGSRGVDTIKCNGEYEDCVGGSGSFAGRNAGGGAAVSTTFSGTAIRCDAGTYSFAGSAVGGICVMSGRVVDALFGDYSVAASASAAGGATTLSGTVLDCTRGSPSCSFSYTEGPGNLAAVPGAPADVTAAARLINVTAAASCFAVSSTDGNATFAGYAEGCTATSIAFGASYYRHGLFSGTAVNCKATENAFGISLTWSAGCVGNGVCSSTSRFDNCVVTGSYGFGFVSNTGVGTATGYFANCSVGVNFGFGASSAGLSLADGTFVGCVVVGNYGFGTSSVNVNYSATFSGIAIGCSVARYGFGCSRGSTGTFSGYAYGCKAADYAFGVSYDGASIYAATCSGKLWDCEASAGRSFGYTAGSGLATFSGKTFNCVAGGNYNFGCAMKGTGSVVFSGTARGCEATGYAFGAIKGDVDVGVGTVTFSGTCSDCYATSNCFAAASGGVGASNAVTVTAAGTFTDCVATSNAFCFSYSGVATMAGKATTCLAAQYAYGATFSTTGLSAIIDATAVLNNCRSNSYGFAVSPAGGAEIRAGAVLEYCTGGDGCFCFASGTAAGSSGLIGAKLTGCTAGRASFLYVRGQTGGVDTATFSSTAVLVGCSVTNLITTDVNSFGYSQYAAISVELGAYFQDCTTISGAVAFGCTIFAAHTVNAGTYVRCGQLQPTKYVGGVSPYVLDFAFGSTYDAAGNATFSGTLIDCVAGAVSFGSARLGVSTFSGKATRTTGGYGCFGYTGNLTAAARLTDCVAGYSSYGRATGAAAAVLERCTISGIDAVGEAPVFNGALLRHCKMVASGAGVSPVRVVAGGTVYLYDCDLLSDAGATEYCVRVSTAAVATVKMDGCRSRSDLDPLITNDLGSAINLIDPNYVVWT